MAKGLVRPHETIINWFLTFSGSDDSKAKILHIFLRNTWSKPKNLLPRNYIKKHKNYLNIPIFIQQSSCQIFLHPWFPYCVYAMQTKSTLCVLHTVKTVYVMKHTSKQLWVFLSGSYRELCCHLVATCKTATYHLILKVKKLMEHEIVKQTERSASFSYLLIFIPRKRPEHKASEAQSQSNNEASSWAHICTLSWPFMRHSYSKQIPVIRTISMTCQHKAVQFYRLTN